MSTAVVATSGARATSSRWVDVARIVGAHGVHGAVRTQLFGCTGAVLVGQQVRMTRDGVEQVTEVIAARDAQRGCLLKLRGIDGREATRRVLGAVVALPTEALPELAPDEYYLHEVCGACVTTIAGESVGTVTRLVDTAGPTLLALEALNGVERLLPCVPPIVQRYDRREHRLWVEVPAGLWE